METKSEARRRIEKMAQQTEREREIILAELAGLSEVRREKPKKRNLKRSIAWAVLLLVIGLAVFPAVGNAWTLFYFGFSLYLWRFFVGLAVVLVAIAGLWAISVLFTER